MQGNTVHISYRELHYTFGKTFVIPLKSILRGNMKNMPHEKTWHNCLAFYRIFFMSFKVFLSYFNVFRIKLSFYVVLHFLIGVLLLSFSGFSGFSGLRIELV